MKTFTVTFHAMNGESLGQVEVSAKTPSKAKILAANIYTCSWCSQSVEAA
ncbi:hypothetical protein AVV12_gp86 [Streptomyces phage SF3]|uniref:Uncharacterized protein n=1 Tax=Streptomyces phage SF3 TaxID=1690818 RepID=A0A0M4R1X2_9CAUD|nr:hypothetical protein AVV12_gp86 [Streptomyces phage SF3]ALF00217.1 hypothetical protein SF3_870 [Streptomyces phage SF3]